MALLCLDSLSKTYPDGTIAVRDISIEINTGEFIVLLGPSGCGKTTALRMLAGLETPTGGRIFLDGQDITSRPPAQRDVGFVFQFYALYPHMTVADNIMGVGRAYEAPSRFLKDVNDKAPDIKDEDIDEDQILKALGDF